MSRSGFHPALTDGEPDPRAWGESNAFGNDKAFLRHMAAFRVDEQKLMALLAEHFDPGPPVITCADCGAEDGAHEEHCMGGR